MKCKTMKTLFASCAVFGLGASVAMADCADEISSLQSDSGSNVEAGVPETRNNEIAKDGSVAPLENADGGESAGSEGEVATTSTTGGQPAEQSLSASTDGSNEVAKDGTQAPLEEDGVASGGSDAGAGGDPSIALSQQDAQAQQEGASGSNSGTRAEALERAQAALDRGDEEGCMDAVEEARSL